MATFDRVDLAYCAGLIDGEGSINMTMRNYNRKTPITRIPTLQVSCQMTDAEGVKLLYKLFGGCYTTYKIKSGKTVYIYASSQNVAKKLLKELLPYLRIKKPQAELALKYCDLPICPTCPGRKTPSWLVTKKVEFYNLMRQLNRAEVRCESI